jgi:nicotinate-nucleotide adenylyltransferase
MIQGNAARYDLVNTQPPVAFPGMRIGLLGGSFNPAHEGHLHISQEAMKRLGFHQVWWLVTPGNPLKVGTLLPCLAERMATARSLTASVPHIKVTGFEAALGSPFTIDTVTFLLRRYPLVRFVWIMGGDNLAQFHRWRQWRFVFEAIPILVMDRPTARLPALASPAALTFAHARVAQANVGALTRLAPPAWAYISIPLSPFSSTAIRAKGLEAFDQRIGTT